VLGHLKLDLLIRRSLCLATTSNFFLDDRFFDDHQPSQKDQATNSDVTVRFWLCSMEAYDKFYPLINREWELIDGIVFGDRARIETRFYERRDHKPFPNKACVADAKVIEVWTEATWWQVDYPGLALACEVSNLHWYREVEQETNPWCLMYMNEGVHGESDDSEEEGSSEDKSEESEDPAEVSFEGSNASKAKAPEENEDAGEESF
jgi:hypothetical protein